MTLELIAGAKGDPHNAHVLALASDLAYLPEAQGAEAFRSQLGLEARLISVGNTQAYIASNDQHVVVAFRGTEAPTSIEGLKDWLLTDAMNLLIIPEGDLGTDFIAAGVGARFHLGFMKALADIWDPVFAAVVEEQKKNERPLWITGHSLGGALAQLAAWRFKRKFIAVHQVYTFGAPMVGNAAAAEAFDRELGERIFRYVNTKDPIPKLPLISLVANQYEHCNKEMALGTAAEAAGSALEFIRLMAGNTVNGILSGTLINDFWNGVKERVGAHGMVNYCGLVEELFKQKS